MFLIILLFNYNKIEMSDSRLHKDSLDLEDSEALCILREIQTKKYTYKDTETQVYGFNSQQIENVVPYSVTTTNDYIPNILKNATLELGMYDICILTFKNDTHNLPREFTGKIKLISKDAEISNLVTIKEVIDNNRFSIHETLVVGEYLVYGIEVNDFKVLNKDDIFTISVAAIKEVDAQLQEARQSLANMKQNTDTLITQNAILNRQYSEAHNDIEKIKTRLGM